MTASNDCGFGPLLSPFHDGELSAARRQEVANHLPTCGDCTAELQEIRKFSGVLGAAELPVMNDTQFDRLERRLATAASAGAMPLPLKSSGRDIGHLRLVRRLSGVAAAVFLLAAGRLAYEGFNPGTIDTGRPVRPAAEETRPKPEGHTPAKQAPLDSAPGAPAPQAG